MSEPLAEPANPLAGRRVAIVHEWVDAYAGSEQVFEALAGIFPQADLIALSNEPGIALETGGRPIKTTFLDRPALRKRRSLTLPLMPLAWRTLGAGGYDVVISSHHAFANTNRLTRDGGAHLSYVHSPARYLWSPEIDERGAARYLWPAKAALRRVDWLAAQNVTAYAANSVAVAKRIKEFWGREATVINPPVRVEFFSEPSPARRTRDYVLGVGRWIPYKNLHRVIEAADIAGMPVKIAGRGPDKSRIIAAVKAAKVPVELIESPSDEELRSLYRNAACLVFPTVEDFGIVPVEAQAAGTPIVAIAKGGVLDTVVPDKSGVLLTGEPTTTQLASAILEATRLDAANCIRAAERFGAVRFRNEIVQWVHTVSYCSDESQAADFSKLKGRRGGT